MIPPFEARDGRIRKLKIKFKDLSNIISKDGLHILKHLVF
jgi:hypothetical protein